MGKNALYLLITILFSTCQGKKRYTKSGPDAYLKNLKERYKVKIQRSTLYYHRANLVIGGWIKTWPRYKNKNDGTIRRYSDMITIKLPGAIWLANMRIPEGIELRDHYLNPEDPEDKRFPNRKDFDEGSWTPERQADRERFDSLLGGVTKPLS